MDVPALNINAIQKELAVFDNNKVSTTPLDPHKHTAYLINHASDLTKLIKFIFFNGQLEQSAIRESLIRVYKEAHSADEGDLAEFTLTLFRHYVVNESGHCVEDIISFIKDCILPLLTVDEQTKLYREILS